MNDDVVWLPLADADEDGAREPLQLRRWRPEGGNGFEVSGRNALRRPTPCAALTINQAPTLATISRRLLARRDNAQRQFVPPVSFLINALLDPRPSLLVGQLCRFNQHVIQQHLAWSIFHGTNPNRFA
jgi:hypothetical protein